MNAPARPAPSAAAAQARKPPRGAGSVASRKSSAMIASTTLGPVGVIIFSFGPCMGPQWSGEIGHVRPTQVEDYDCNGSTINQTLQDV